MNFSPLKVLAIAALSLSLAGAAQAQAYVNVTAGGAFAPGVFGQISLSNNPVPPVWNAQPIIYGQPAYGAPVMYLNVPHDEQRDWGRHCARYRACGHPVHFVRVEQNNRWWENHSQHLRGPGYYRQLEARPYGHRYEGRSEYRRDQRDERNDHQRDTRHESRRSER